MPVQIDAGKEFQSEAMIDVIDEATKEYSGLAR